MTIIPVEMLEMEMHETLHPKTDNGANVEILRVPGGWIYKHYEEQVGGHFHVSQVFVPGDHESL